MMQIKAKWQFENKELSVNYKINKDTNHIHAFTSTRDNSEEVYSYKIFPDTISPVINAITTYEELKGNHLRNFLLSEIPDLNNHYSFSGSVR